LINTESALAFIAIFKTACIVVGGVDLCFTGNTLTVEPEQLVFEDVFVREVELTADIVAKALEKMAFLAFGKVSWRQE
jgi:hypothetical protein